MRTSRLWIWLLVIPTALGAVAMLMVQSTTTKRYRSEAGIVVVPAQVTEDLVASGPKQSVDERVRSMAQQLLSRTRLERMIVDQNLYPAERKVKPIDDAVQQMRRDITITLTGPTADPAVGNHGVRVSYESADPTAARTVTALLASLLIDANLRDRELMAEGTLQFLAVQIEDIRRRLLESQIKLDAARAKGVAHADLAMLTIDNETLQTIYRRLTERQAQANMAANLERRQIGEQFKLIDPAGPARLVNSPNRVMLALTGAGGGFVLGLILVLVASLRRRRTAVRA